MQYIDILDLTETKLDDTFPTTQFLVNGFSEPYRLNRNRNGEGLIFSFVRIFRINCQINMFFRTTVKVYLLNSILGNINGFLEHATHHPKQIFIILIICIKHLTLNTSYKNRLRIDFSTETYEPRTDSLVYEHDYIIL